MGIDDPRVMEIMNFGYPFEFAEGEDKTYCYWCEENEVELEGDRCERCGDEG